MVLSPPRNTLSVSCVTFKSNPQLLQNTIDSLARSCRVASNKGVLGSVTLFLIDNGPDSENLQLLELIKLKFIDSFRSIIVKSGQGNVGYGRGHNISLEQMGSCYHLILNPDVTLDEENLYQALSYMNENSQIALLAPDAFDEDGARQYIAKRNPNLLILAMRAFKLKPKISRLQRMLDLYEYRDQIPAGQPLEILHASGCYMLFKSEVLSKIGGFDPKYFMYFEDFEISRRTSVLGKVIHHPAVKIIHAGGNSFGKGLRHQFYFLMSWLKFTVRLNK